jgi:hypothetical protein
VLRKIISACQTDADRAGLDFAIEVGLEDVGFVPRDAERKKAECRSVALCRVFEYLCAMRTKRNVREADGTVVFSLDSILTGAAF